MNCMKCGREIALGQVFCKECLEDMDAHPIKQGTPVVIPVRETPVAPRRSSIRRARKPEDQILFLRRLLLFVSIVLVAVCAAFAITTSVLMKQLHHSQTALPPGQNYSTEPIQSS